MASRMKTRTKATSNNPRMSRTRTKTNRSLTNHRTMSSKMPTSKSSKNRINKKIVRMSNRITSRWLKRMQNSMLKNSRPCNSGYAEFRMTRAAYSEESLNNNMKTALEKAVFPEMTPMRIGSTKESRTR